MRPTAHPIHASLVRPRLYMGVERPVIAIEGTIAAVEQALAIADDRTIIVPGHGPLADRAQLASYRDMLQDLEVRVAEAIAAGQSLDEIRALRLADPYGRDTDFISPDSFIETLYRSLTSETAEHRHR